MTNNNSAMGEIYSYFALVVPRYLVKRIKDALDAHQRLDKSIKITPMSRDLQWEIIEGSVSNEQDRAFQIPLQEGHSDDFGVNPLSKLLKTIGFHEDQAKISLVIVSVECTLQNNVVRSKANLLVQTLEQWLHQQSSKGQDKISLGIVGSMNWSYMVYPPLLLLPPTFMKNLSSIFPNTQVHESLLSLFSLICKQLHVTHIALNAPIPDSVGGNGDFEDAHDNYDGCQNQQVTGLQLNILRSPTDLNPVYGDFGPFLPPEHTPTVQDFDAAFWCTAQQNGIHQTWAPRYTMFSRGNISEKARVLNLPSLTECRLGSKPQDTSAIDLYAGIGYFAFSYAKAGIGKVLCWEINPWSVEGLRRGALANRWSVGVVNEKESRNNTDLNHYQLIVFQERNQKAVETITQMRHTIPPIRHINCGFLPSSKDSWEIAIKLLDRQGGWIHVHENIAKKDIDARKGGIIENLTDFADQHLASVPEHQWMVECEHIEEVKSYAPGISHYVLDIAFTPSRAPT